MTVHVFENQAMNCPWRLCIPDSEGNADELEPTVREAWRLLDELEDQLSLFRAGSEVLRLSSAMPGEVLCLTPAAHDCLQWAVQLHETTGGAFDVSLGTGLHKLSLLDGLQAQVTEPGLELDLGGIGKGYAMDELVNLLTDLGIEAGRIDSGASTVRAFGIVPASLDQVQLRTPTDPDAAPLATIRLAGRTLAGSGSWLYGPHIVDSRTEESATPPAKAASWALHPAATIADALSTAFLLQTAEQMQSTCEALPESAGLQIHGGQRHACRWPATS